MARYMSRPILAAAALIVTAATAFAAPSADNDAHRGRHAMVDGAGPVQVTANDIVQVCVTNLATVAHPMRIALLNGARAPGDVTTPLLLASRQVSLAPGQGACLTIPQQQLPQGVSSVVALVRHVGVGIGPGGGCIASLQLLSAATGQAMLFAPLAPLPEAAGVLAGP